MSMNKAATILIILMFLMLGWSISIYTITWYGLRIPIPVTQKTYYPGDEVELHLDRYALINLEGQITRSLFRIDGVEEYEVLKVATYKNTIARGIKSITTYYKLPTLEICPHLKGNSYIWRGTLSYKPFGIFQRELHFETEKFNIKILENNFLPSLPKDTQE